MMNRFGLLLCAVAALGGCRNGTEIPDAIAPPLAASSAAANGPKAAASAPAMPAHAAATSAAPAPAAPTAAPLDTAPYPWHADASIEPLEAVDTLEARFPAPAGFGRVELPPESFGAWLRRVPLAAAGTPVRANDGRVLYPPNHRNIGAVTTLDIGKADLQQCADAVMRLHAEWLWHRGRAEEASYPTGAGPIPWRRFLRGEQPVAEGNSFRWGGRRRAKPDSHADYRKYLNIVFSWANTVSLARKAYRPRPEQLRPGDFFIQPGSPGHSVLVLDVARSEDGRIVALLGQSYMPAQNFQVLRPSPEQPWFQLSPATAVVTPFWRPFQWDELARWDEPVD